MSRSKIPPELRALVSGQARRRCGYCLTQERIVGYPMEIDHLIPESLNGRTEEGNLWLACSSCNDHKNDRIAAVDPESETGRGVRLFNPRWDSWADHFRWSEEGTVIVGLTPKGRATVAALNVNRDEVVAARRLWVGAGWHPPAD